MLQKLKLIGEAVLVVLAVAGPAAAETDMQLALDLGDVVGSEGICGMKFEQPAIAAFIEARVPADDTRFIGIMNTAANVMDKKFARFSASQQTAHCTQMRRVAKSFGFVK